MIKYEAIESFLKEFKIKLKIWGVLFLGREKNLQTLADLEITPKYREEVLSNLEIIDYSKGPITDKILRGVDLWVFGKRIKGQEVYIKITLGNANEKVLCISFHLAEYSMQYPIKRNL